MKTQNKDITGSYKTPDGKAQIDFGITYRNGYAEFTASGHYDGSTGQCIDSITKAYPDNEMVRSLANWHCAHHLERVKPEFVEKVKRAAEHFPFTSFYDTQAENFLTSNGLKFRATLSDSKTPAWSDDGRHGHHYRVTLSKGRHCSRCGTAWAAGLRECGNCGLFDNRDGGVVRPARLTFDFWGSIKDAEDGATTVKPYDVLACISGDAYCPDTFKDFCGEYGYDQDSIKALQTFRQCSAFAKRLLAFFTDAELEQLSNIR